MLNEVFKRGSNSPSPNLSPQGRGITYGASKRGGAPLSFLPLPLAGEGDKGDGVSPLTALIKVTRIKPPELE
jgi:hypothetical protein